MVTVIVVLNWNGWSDTKRLVSSLIENGVSAPIWVVDNGSRSDESQGILNIDPKVRIVKLSENFGFAGGMNRAIQLAAEGGYKFVYAINNDCLVNSDVLTPIIKAAQAFPEVAILGSRYLSRDKRGEYTRWGFHSDPKERKSFKNGVLLTDRIVGCGMLVKVDLFLKAGGFDERFFCYGEENDLCCRFRKLGYQVGFCYDSLILHNHQGSDVSGNAAYYRSRNTFLLCRLHPENANHKANPLFILDKAWLNLLKLDYTLCSAYVEGLHHGVRGQFGKREIIYSVSFTIALLVLYSLFFLPMQIVRVLKRSKRIIGSANE
jgi:GT2 family glycosyltransferase